MKRLIVFRHAKAVPHDVAPDFERALAGRGLADAEVTGRYLADEMLLPDLALVSPSLRTRQTWARASAVIGTPVPVRIEDGIYEAPVGQLLGLLQAVPPEVRTVVLVGHNPGVSQLSRDLTGHGDRYAFARLRAKFPTSAIAVLDFPVESWADVAPGGGRLDRFVTPAGDTD